MPFSVVAPGRSVTTFGPSRLQPARYIISGLCLDAGSNPVVGATVEVFEAASGLLRAVTTSAADGSYSVDVTGPDTGLTFQAVAVAAGGATVGCTVNTLVGTPS